MSEYNYGYETQERRQKVLDATTELIETLHKEYGWFNDEELKNTPLRIAKFYEEWYDNKNGFTFTTFPIKEEVMTIMTNINFYSMCAHHLLPFFGTVNIAYLPKPNGKICGASKLVRAVTKIFSKPGTQEPMTVELTDYLYARLENPDFLMVQVSGTHTCMMIRGVKQKTSLITSGLRFNHDMKPQLNHLKSEAFDAWRMNNNSNPY
jgi:GTP cyclohydrolase I